MASYNEKPMHKRIAQKIFEGLISTGAVYLFAPQLLTLLSPLQAQINANAAASGATPTTNGVSAVANLLIQPATPPATTTVPSNTPISTPTTVQPTPPAVATVPVTPGSTTGT